MVAYNRNEREMKSSLRTFASKRAIVILLSAVLLLSAFNTYLILGGIQSANRTNALNYDYVLSKDGDNYLLKNVLTGYVTQQSGGASAAINAAMLEGKSVYLNPGTYQLTDDILIINKIHAKIVGNNNAVIDGKGHKILVYGDSYNTQRSPLISGLTLINTTIRVENAFGTTIQNILFANASIAIEFANTKDWSEFNKIENCQFINVTEGIVFRTPVENATGSYASSIIEHCSFNLQDFSVGIKVEQQAELSDSQIQNVRFWMGENEKKSNQTGIYVDGSMFHTLLLGVVFESFTSEPIYIFGIEVGPNCDPAPTLTSGVSFLGNWTAKIHNPHSSWLNGEGAIFKQENLQVPVGTNNQYGTNQTLHIRPLTIYSFNPKITVDGSFPNNETVTVRVRIEYIDNYISGSVVRSFASSGSVWLSDVEIMQLLPSQSIVWAIIVDAKTNAGSTDAVVKFSGYGTAG
jgi:hypothetical protein